MLLIALVYFILAEVTVAIDINLLENFVQVLLLIIFCQVSRDECKSCLLQFGGALQKLGEKLNLR